MTAEYNHTPSITYQLATAGDKDSLESSHSTTSGHKKYPTHMKLLPLDSVYVSEADLDASHSSTATNSQSASPKLTAMTEKADEEVAAAKEEKKEDNKEDKMEDKKPENDDGEANKKAEEEQVNDKSLKEFASNENSFSSPASLSSSDGMLFQQPSPQAYYCMSPRYISNPFFQLVIPMQQPLPYCTFVPTQDSTKMQGCSWHL